MATAEHAAAILPFIFLASTSSKGAWFYCPRQTRGIRALRTAVNDANTEVGVVVSRQTYIRGDSAPYDVLVYVLRVATDVQVLKTIA
jgi:hypothetical protein